MLTVPEAARRAGRNPETVRRWIRSGKLRAQRVGTQHLIAEEDLAALTEHDVTPLPPGWDVMDDGGPMPFWERIVRDSRSRH